MAKATSHFTSLMTWTASLTDAQVVALTIWAEARNQPVQGIVACAQVIRNRVTPLGSPYGVGYKGVCFKRHQFSCWWFEDANYDGLMLATTELVGSASVLNPTNAATFGNMNKFPRYEECLWVAKGVMSGIVRDMTRGATHYLTKQLYDTSPPTWTKGMSPRGVFGDHIFFMETR